MDDDKIIRVDDPIILPKGVDTKEEAESYIKNLILNMLKGEHEDESVDKNEECGETGVVGFSDPVIQSDGRID